MAHTLNGLRATTLEVALLMNFGRSATLKRLVMDNDTKKSVKSVKSVLSFSPEAAQA